MILTKKSEQDQDASSSSGGTVIAQMKSRDSADSLMSCGDKDLNLSGRDYVEDKVPCRNGNLIAGIA